MAQAFVTTYKNYFRWPEIERRKPMRQADKFAEELPKGDIWIIPKKIGEDDGEGGESLQSALAAIKYMYRRRLWSIYQTSYCRDMMPKRPREEEGESIDNAILFYGKSLYGAKKQKIPPPLPTSRRVHGYLRPTGMYSPLTTYQDVHGRVGYQILDDPHSIIPVKVPAINAEVPKHTQKAMDATSKDARHHELAAITDDQMPVLTEEEISKVIASSQNKALKLDDCACALLNKHY